MLLTAFTSLNNTPPQSLGSCNMRGKVKDHRGVKGQCEALLFLISITGVSGWPWKNEVQFL